MHSLLAGFVPRRDVLLCIRVRKSILMLGLAPIDRARRRRVPILHIETTQETHVPVGEVLGGV